MSGDEQGHDWVMIGESRQKLAKLKESQLFNHELVYSQELAFLLFIWLGMFVSHRKEQQES